MTATHGHLNVAILLYHTGWSLLYSYTSDLLCLDFCRPPRPHTNQLLHSVSTPLCPEAWAAALAPHPDQAFARYICDGLRWGFRIGFQYGSPLKSASTNMPSATQHPQVVTKYIQDELSRGRMLGPFHSPQGLPPLHINRFGVIPKGHNTGKWRLITDLSFPHGKSVNDGVDQALCSLSYTTVDDIAAVVPQLGSGTLLAKVDIELAYRLIPVHPHGHPLGLALRPQVGGPSVGTSPQNADRRPRSRDSNTHTHMHVALPRRRRYACTHISYLGIA